MRLSFYQVALIAALLGAADQNEGLVRAVNITSKNDASFMAQNQGATELSYLAQEELSKSTGLAQVGSQSERRSHKSSHSYKSSKNCPENAIQEPIPFPDCNGGMFPSD